MRKPIRWSALALAAAAMLAIPAVPNATAAPGLPGDLDQSFGTGGLASTKFRDYAEVYALVLQGHRIVAGGITTSSAGQDWAIVRYRADGTLDRNFATKGRFALDFGGYEGVTDLTVLSDGKILATGGGHGVFIAVRLTRNGHLDSTFGRGDGIVRTKFGPDFAYAMNLVVVKGGRFVIAGGYAGTTESVVALARYLPDGRLDTRFSGDGKVLTDVWPAADQSDQVGDLLRVGNTNAVTVVASDDTGDPDPQSILLAQYTGRGRLDRSFGGGDGWVVQNVGAWDIVQAAVRMPDGSILVGGSVDFGTDIDPLVARFTSDGNLDTSWGGGDGYVNPETGYTVEYWMGMTRVGSKLVLVGRVGTDSAVLRLISSGATDATFGGSGNGLVVISHIAGESELMAVTAQRDGKLLVGGTVPVPSGHARLGVLRLLS